MAIEVNSGDVLRQVKLLTRHLVAAQAGFSASSSPSETDLQDGITTAEGEIMGWLSSFGYGIDTTQWPDIAKQYLSWFNALGAAYHVELGATGLATGPRASTRANEYYELYQGLYTQLAAGSIQLSALGIPLSATTRLSGTVTGVSDSDKQILETDTDAVPPSFFREIFSNPRRIRTPTRGKPINPEIHNT